MNDKIVNIKLIWTIRHTEFFAASFILYSESSLERDSASSSAILWNVADTETGVDLRKEAQWTEVCERRFNSVYNPSIVKTLGLCFICD